MSDVYMEALQAHNEQRFDEAESCIDKALVFADQNNNAPMIALTMHQLGRLSFEQETFIAPCGDLKIAQAGKMPTTTPVVNLALSTNCRHL